MILNPSSREELCRQLAAVAREKTRLDKVDLASINSLVEHVPEDMTATVEGGMRLAEFQRRVGRAGQWLPLDPPGAEAVTIADLVANDLSGPRRFGYGTVRDYLIGVKVALATGELIKAGGKVVKNVAGYDLCKLFTGARHTLGTVVEATFKLRPLPEAELIQECPFDSVEKLHGVWHAILQSVCEPVIADAYRRGGDLILVVGFAGAREDVAYQREVVSGLASWRASATSYDEEFAGRSELRRRISVLPSKMPEVLRGISGECVARYGNGVIYVPGSTKDGAGLPNEMLATRVKSTYDPAAVFPQYSL